MSLNENIYHFNHIDKSKTKEEIQEIKELYKFYYYSERSEFIILSRRSGRSLLTARGFSQLRNSRLRE